MNRIFLVLVLAGLLALAANQTAVLADPAVTITVDADPSTPGVQASRTVAQRSTFVVDVLIGSVSDLQAFNFELVYDEAVLSAPTITTGPDTDRNPDADQTFLSSTDRTWACSPPAPSGDIDPSPTVGAAFLSCYSTGASPGPDVGSSETVFATVEFHAISPVTSSLTLRNVNTFRQGGVETGSCNPTVITPATCTGASITVEAVPVGGVAELPDVAEGSSSSATNYVVLTGLAAAALAALGTGGWYARRRWQE
jgi:hypothetical protein